MRSYCAAQELQSALCDGLERWDGRGQEGEREDLCMIMANLHCCMAETNTILQKLKSGKKKDGESYL